MTTVVALPSIRAEELFDSLKEALPIIAKVTGGYATITDNKGVRLYTVDSDGIERQELVGQKFLAVEQYSQPSMCVSDLVSEAESWVLPLGPFILACSNVERVQRAHKLFDALHKTLPVIARLCGGEAVLFDASGRRLASYAADGTASPERVGTMSLAAAEAMTTNCPTVGPSTSVKGAVAVRFPVTQSFGFGFNNEQTVKRETRLLQEVRKKSTTRYSLIDIEGESEAINNVKKLARSIATGDSSILISGETGTGKELFAQAIHNESPRRDKPFVAINCGALPASIIESSLFGYEPGSFTGARKGGGRGAFEDANGGTLFLDEVSEMDYSLQNKILRALQEREIVKVGGTKPIPVNIRVLSATNRDLRAMVQSKEFRMDLYYRLNVVQLNIPPLRERLSDIASLVRTFITKNNMLFGKFVFSPSQEVMNILMLYNWTGNVRELQNCIEHAFNMLSPREKTLLPNHLPRYLLEGREDILPTRGETFAKIPSRPIHMYTLKESMLMAEREVLEQALEFTGNNKQQAAKLLGVSHTTLWRRICAVGLNKHKKSVN